MPEGTQKPPSTAAQHLALWFASRVTSVCVAYVSVFDVHDEGWQTWERLRVVLARRWDAEYYLRIAEQGYPSVLPSRDVLTHHWGFYPLYGWLISLVAAGTTLPADLAALLINAAAGVTGVLLLGRWLKRRLDDRETLWAVAFFSFWTQSYFFTYAYAEPVYFTLLCLSLLMLDKEEPPPAHVPLAFVLGTITGLCRPYAVVVAMAAWVAALWRLPRPGFIRHAFQSRLLLASTLFGAGSALSMLFVWYGNCRLHTGLWENCVVRAWEIGWGYNTSSLPAAFRHDLLLLYQRQPLTFWHLVKAWELVAWGISAWVLVYAIRKVPRWGATPAVLALLPLVTNTTYADVTSVARYMATTPTVFLWLATLQASPGQRGVLLGGVVVMHVVMGVATATGVWQSF
jgi:hypothetical protein